MLAVADALDAQDWTGLAKPQILLHGQPDDETCLLYTSDAADERSSVDLGGRRIIKKKKRNQHCNDEGQDNTDTKRPHDAATVRRTST